MTIYALFVAVSEYPKGISNLEGCLNDVAAIEKFFREYADRNEVTANFKTLINGEATRAKVIENFSHFEAAGPEDICLFYFTGHGAQMLSPKEFEHLEVKRRLQTMVLHDSRLPGGKDLADKEISYLLANHTKDSGQVIVIADSCHSGTISRLSVGMPRTIPENGAAMKIEEFHGYEEYDRNGQFYSPPVKSHITLAACRPEQVAMEMPIRGVRHGLFTHYLIEVMSGMDLASCSYAELMARVRVRVKNHHNKQDVFAQAYGAASLDRRFFNGALKKNRDFVLHHDKTDGWFVEQGAMAGVAEGTKVVILDGGEERELRVRRVDAGRAFIADQPFLAPAAAPYPLISIDKKMDPLVVYLDATMHPLPQGTLRNLIEGEADSLRLTTDPDQAKYHVTELPDYGISLVLPGESRPLYESVPAGSGNKKLEEFVERMARVSASESTLKLAPQANALNPDEVVDITLEQVLPNEYGEIIGREKRRQDGKAVFSYTVAGDEMLPGLLRLSVKVKTDQLKPLYVGMLFFDEAFGVSGKYLPVIKLEAGDNAVSTRTPPDDKNDGTAPVEFIVMEIPEEVQSWGINEVTNTLKVIVSETEFSLDQWEQDGILQQKRLTDPLKSKRAAGGIGGLFKRRPDRWGVKDIPVTIYRPLFAGEKTFAGTDVKAPMQVANAPTGFSFGHMTLDSSMSNTRAMSGDCQPLCPVREGLLMPMSLMASRSGMADETPLDMVKLYDVQNAEAVTEDNPLELASAMVEAGGMIFAYDEDTGRYYPIGFPDREKGVMVLNQLPPAQPEEYAKSLGGSVKLFFRQVIRDHLPWPLGELNKLRVASIQEDMTTEYLLDDPDQVRKKISETEGPIALFIHGIIGDTTTAPAILRRAKLPDGKPWESKYDLLLTYDYENLKTPIRETAERLQGQLKAVGLGENHGKTLHVYAHSMGGLVSRAFIEMLHGRQIVSHLIQFGTPNGGSPYGNVAQWVTPLLSRALESGAAAASGPFVPALLGLRWFINTALATLQEMKIGSDFLKRLEQDGDRGSVPYTMINGNIRLLPDVEEEDMKFFARIVAKLDYQTAVDKVFFQAPTDIAVSVKSQRQVPGLVVEEQPVASDHMSYFVTPDSIARLEGYSSDIFPDG